MPEDMPSPLANSKDREPVGLTLADLVAIVAGAAVLLAMPVLRLYWPDPREFPGVWPRWLPWTWATRQILTGACLALVPVILARRFRYGGMARPAEFLAACCGLPLLVDWVEILLIRAYVRARGGSLPGSGLVGMPAHSWDAWRDGPHRAFQEGVLLTGVAAAVGVYLGRKRLPGWLLTALVLVAWLGLYSTVPVLLTRAFVLSIYHATGNVPVGPMGGALIDLLINLLPTFLMFSVPACLAFHDLRSSGAPRPTWLARTGLALASLLFLVTETSRHLQLYGESRGGLGFWVGSPTRAVATLLAAILAPTFARRLEPFWERPVGPRFTEQT